MGLMQSRLAINARGELTPDGIAE